jgi:hypothetical protein
MYPLGRIAELRNKSPGFWAKAAMDTSTRITTAVTEIELMTRTLPWVFVEDRVCIVFRTIAALMVLS